MSGIYKYFMVSVVALINFHAIHSEQYILDTYGVSAETSATFLELYREEITKEYAYMYDLTEKKKKQAMETLVGRLYFNFKKIRDFSIFTPRDFIHYMILTKQRINDEADEVVFSAFLFYYKDGLDAYYAMVTMMNTSKIDKEIMMKFYNVQVLLYLRIYNSYYVDSSDPMIKMDDFLRIMIEYAQENREKFLMWDESLREIINAHAEKRRLRMWERPSYKVDTKTVKKREIASSSNLGLTSAYEVDEIDLISRELSRHLRIDESSLSRHHHQEDDLDLFPVPPRENEYFDISFGDYLLFIELYTSEISEYFEKIHKKNIFEEPEEKLWETTESYIRELYDDFCIYRTEVCRIIDIDAYIIYLMFSKQIKKVPTCLLLKFIEAFENELNSLCKNVTFSPLPDDKTDPFYSKRLLYNLNMHNAPRLNSNEEVLRIDTFIDTLIQMKPSNEPISVEKIKIDGVNNSLGVSNETFNSLKELYKNEIQNYKQKSYKAEQSDHMHIDDIDERDVTESFVIHEYSEFIKYHTFLRFTIKEYIQFLVIQINLKKFNIFGNVIIREKFNVPENHLSTFLSYYEEDLNAYYKYVMFVDLTEDKKIDFYTNQLMFYYSILNSYNDETETQTTLDQFIELIKTDAERKKMRNSRYGSSSTPNKPLIWSENAPEIIENELIEKKRKISTFENKNRNKRQLSPLEAEDRNKRQLSPLEAEALEGIEMLKSKRRKDDSDQIPRHFHELSD